MVGAPHATKIAIERSNRITAVSLLMFYSPPFLDIIIFIPIIIILHVLGNFYLFLLRLLNTLISMIIMPADIIHMQKICPIVRKPRISPDR